MMMNTLWPSDSVPMTDSHSYVCRCVFRFVFFYLYCIQINLRVIVEKSNVFRITFSRILCDVDIMYCQRHSSK